VVIESDSLELVQSLKHPPGAGSTDANLIEKLHVLFTSPNYNRNLKKPRMGNKYKIMLVASPCKSYDLPAGNLRRLQNQQTRNVR
jgi:hypothetical protein